MTESNISTIPTAATSVPTVHSTTTTQPTAGGGHVVSSSSNNKRPLMTTDKDGNQLSEKKLRRLEKNRLSARECRRRKREATEGMLCQINALEAENLRLRLQLQIGEEAEDCRGEEQDRVTRELDKLLKSKACSEAEMHERIEAFQEKFADYGRDRRSAIEFHLQNVERLLIPTQTTSVALRALHGTTLPSSSTTTGPPGAPITDAAATQTASDPQISAKTQSANQTNDTKGTASLNLEDPKALFQYLVQYLNVTPQQALALKDSRYIAQELDTSLATSLDMVHELKMRVTQILHEMATEFENVLTNILTPTQAAKFLIWVSNQPACMQLLNELWRDSLSSSSSSSSS